MSLWGIVPVKPLRRGKSRLSGVLTEDERSELNNSMLDNTLRTLSSVAEIKQVLVISRDPIALSLARQHGARTVQEDSSSELNAALGRATAVALTYGAKAVLILPADLPLISGDDIKEFLAHEKQPPELLIAPDRRGDGTNALYINPAGEIKYCFGRESFRLHVQQAEEKNYHVEVCRLSKFGLDLDLPEDLELLQTIQSHHEK